MKLLMLSGDARVAQGEEGPFFNTLSELRKHWTHIDVVVPYANGAGTQHLFANVHLHPAAAPQRWRLLLHLSRTGRALINDGGHRVITSHDYGLFFNGWAAARLSSQLGVPYVSEIHHVEGHPRAATTREQQQHWLTSRYVAWAAKRAAAFRVVNRNEMPPLLQQWGVAPDRIRVWYSLYLDFSVFHPQPAPIVYDAIFVARLVANKGLFLLLQALDIARNSRPGLRVLVVGEGPLAVEFDARVAALGLSDHVTRIGSVDTPLVLADYMRRSRCLLCTSFSEGGPRVVAEALACGVPVITTPIGLAAELVEDGENGYQATWSADALAEKLLLLLGDEPHRVAMATAAPAAVARFEKSQVVREYAAGLRAVAAAGRAKP